MDPIDGSRLLPLRTTQHLQLPVESSRWVHAARGARTLLSCLRLSYAGPGPQLVPNTLHRGHEHSAPPRCGRRQPHSRASRGSAPSSCAANMTPQARGCRAWRSFISRTSALSSAAASQRRSARRKRRCSTQRQLWRTSSVWSRYGDGAANVTSPPLPRWIRHTSPAGALHSRMQPHVRARPQTTRAKASSTSPRVTS